MFVVSRQRGLQRNTVTDHVFSLEFAHTDRSAASAKAHSKSAKTDEFIFPGNEDVSLFQEKCLLVSDN